MCISRSFTCSGSDEARMSKRRWTAFETLLTFWPPAPCARTAVSSTSCSGTTSVAALILVFGLYPLGRVLPRLARRGGGVALAVRAGGDVGVGALLGRDLAEPARRALGADAGQRVLVQRVLVERVLRVGDAGKSGEQYE